MDHDVNLPSVVQRFRESADALEALRERIRTLELAEQVQERAASALDTSATSMDRSASALGEAATTLASACRTTETSMELARRLLEASDVTSLRADVAETRRAQLGAADELTLLRTLVQSWIDEDRSRLRDELTSAQAALRALEAKVAAVPEKQRRKLGLV